MSKLAIIFFTLTLPLLGFSLESTVDKKLEMKRSLNSKLEEALTQQMNMEFQAFYMYLGMAAYFDGLNLSGFSKWCRDQSKEEHSHAMKIFDFFQDRGSVPLLKTIQQVDSKYTTPLAAMQSALNSERRVTLSIHNLYTLAQSEQEYDALIFLQWYINEQVEEESTVSRLCERMGSMMSAFEGNLYLIDRELEQTPR